MSKIGIVIEPTTGNDKYVDRLLFEITNTWFYLNKEAHHVNHIHFFRDMALSEKHQLLGGVSFFILSGNLRRYELQDFRKQFMPFKKL